MSIVSDYTAVLAYPDYAPGRWNADHALGTPVIVSYSFLTDADLPRPSEVAFEPASVTALDGAQRLAFRQATASYADTAGLVFVEVPSGSPAMIDVFAANDSSVAGFATIPTVEFGETDTGYVAFDMPGTWEPGSWPYFVVLHEIGHALGLKHPHEGSITLDPAIDDTARTVLSYNSVYPYVTDLGPLDVEALTHLYGAPLGPTGVMAEWNAAKARVDLVGSDADDVVIGPVGTTFWNAGGGDDLAIGRQGADRMLGGMGADTLHGGRGEDVLNGNGEDDSLVGGDDDDTIFGGTGDDILDGGGWSDVLVGGLGDDMLLGDWGDDRLVGGGGMDRITGGIGADTVLGGADADVIDAGDEGDFARGQDGDDTVDGGRGDDLLTGDGGDDVMMGEDGDDRLFGGDGADRMSGGDGDDRLRGGDGDDVVTGGAGDDRVSGDLGDDRIDGEAGADVLQGWGGDDVLTGGDGADVLIAGDDDDVLLGGADDDVLLGGRGADVLDGGAGDDTMSGGAGVDAFVFAGGADRITDWDAEAIRFDAAALGLVGGEIDVVLAASRVEDDDLVFERAGAWRLTVEGAARAEDVADHLVLV